MIGSVAGILGVALFQACLSRSWYRRAFWTTTLLQVAAATVDIVIVQRWNRRVGISDRVFYILGGSMLQEVVYMLDFMPAVVLISKLCPPGVESTVYALLAGFANFGFSVASALGALAIDLFGIRARAPCDFGKLAWLIFAAKMVLPLLTVPLTFLLIPDARMTDDLVGALTPAGVGVGGGGGGAGGGGGGGGRGGGGGGAGWPPGSACRPHVGRLANGQTAGCCWAHVGVRGGADGKRRRVEDKKTKACGIGAARDGQDDMRNHTHSYHREIQRLNTYAGRTRTVKKKERNAPDAHAQHRKRQHMLEKRKGGRRHTTQTRRAQRILGLYANDRESTSLGLTLNSTRAPKHVQVTTPEV